MRISATRRWSAAPLALSLLIGAAAARAQTRVTAPEAFFGHPIGADYVLPDYRRFAAYWRTLDAESDRITVVSIGKTTEGRDQLMAIVTAPENHRNLSRYKEISRRLARAEALSDEQARALAHEGKAVVWIDGGLHAGEVLGAQQLLETVYQLVSRDDPETLRILDDVILLAVHANPDGHDLVAHWYMREDDPTRRSTAALPRLYHKYIGHDNNRDFFASTQPETENMNRQLYREWFPQILYDHHQAGPSGTVMFAPPFRDPFNYNYDPLVVVGIDLVAAAMHNRFIAEGKAGVTMRNGANYSTWWNGGLRTTAYFHNMIGLLTETIGNPTPIELPFLPERQLPSGDLPLPIPPQKWHFRRSVDYSVTANYAVLDIASRYRETFLYNIYRMGRNSIERGSRDNWTLTPGKISRAAALLDARRKAADASRSAGPSGPGRGAPDSTRSRELYAALHAPELRDPRGYIIPADQPDFPTATKFVNALLENGIIVHRATRDFQVNGTTYPAGSYVIKTAQAFRPHILDMFEPQDHPDDFRYPGGPPIPPYDNAGWTLALQMGIRFDRILDPFDGPFAEIDAWNVEPPPGKVIGAAARAAGFLLSHRPNDAFTAINRLLADGEEVLWLNEPVAVNGTSYEPGTFYIPAHPTTLPRLRRLAARLGLTFEAITAPPRARAFRLRPRRIALWDRYGGSTASGWVRWILEQFGFTYQVVYPPALDTDDLRQQYDVIIFVDGAIPERDAAGPLPEDTLAARIPPEYHHMLGRVTVRKTIPRLRTFLEQGGTILAIGSSTDLGYHLGLPMSNSLVERTPDGAERRLRRDEYYVPGSILEARADGESPLAHGIGPRVHVFFDNSPVFRLAPDAPARGLRRVAWFDTARPLRSGWAWGQHYLEGAVAIAEADVGKGKLFLFGPEITFRAQPHGTFKFLFNGIYYGGAEMTALE